MSVLVEMARLAWAPVLVFLTPAVAFVLVTLGWERFAAAMPDVAAVVATIFTALLLLLTAAITVLLLAIWVTTAQRNVRERQR